MVKLSRVIVHVRELIESSIFSQVALRIVVVLLPLVLAVTTAAVVMHSTAGQIEGIADEVEVELLPVNRLGILLHQTAAAGYALSLRAEASSDERLGRISQVDAAFDEVLGNAALTKERGDLLAARDYWARAAEVLESKLSPRSNLEDNAKLFRLWMGAGTRYVGQARQLAELDLKSELRDAEHAQEASWPLLIGICAIALLLGVVMAWRLARHLILPIRLLRDAANRFSTGDLGHRIKTRRSDELGELARAFDSMAGQIEGTHRELARLALHDSLTALPNRVLLADRLDHALATHQRRGGCSALLLIDVDDFKRINDAFGHEAGDEALRIVGQRITDLSRNSDTVARLGGDEFAVLLEDVDTQEAARAFALRCLEDLRRPAMVSDRRIMLEASIGLVMVEDRQLDVRTVMHRADLAMYAAKAAGKGRVACFSLDLEQDFESRLVMENDLHSIIESGFGIFFDYQPIIELSSGRMVGAEALMRMRHPEHGVLPPAGFIMVAEESGLITSLTPWALRDACSNARAWAEIASDTPLPYVSVNLSPRQLEDPRLLSVVRSAIEQAGIAPSQLLLEITETTMMVNHEAVLSVLSNLREYGVRIAIDDFGTGYSSLSYLKDLPVDVLKIDKSFVDELATEGGKALVETISTMARTLGLETVAEGVEQHDQVQELVEAGCRYAQGFYFSRPVSPDQIGERLEQVKAEASMAPR